MAVVPKLGTNYPPGVICDSSMGNAVPKSQCLLGIMSDHCRRNFRTEIRKTFIEYNTTESLPWFG